MSEEDDIKKKLLEKRLTEMQSGTSEAQVQEAQEAIKKLISNILDDKARERLANLRLVKPDLAFQIESYLAQLYQAGYVKGKITEEQIVVILKKIGEKKDFKIHRE